MAAAGQLSAGERDALLDAHNRWRRAHQAPPLAWDTTLARYAQAWAAVLVRDHPGLLVHSDDARGPLPEARALGYAGWGENLSWFSPVVWSDGRREMRRDVGPAQVVDAWGAEVRWYDFATGRCAPEADPGCGHFTQVVWAATARVGCGRAVGPDRAQVWACSYDPPGNWDGEYGANVRPPVPSGL